MRSKLRTLLRILLFPFRVLGWLLRGIGRWILAVASDVRNFFAEEPEDTPLPDTFVKTIENPSGILVHLDALRKHLMRSVLFLAITTAFSFTFAEQILKLLSRPLEGGAEALVAIDVTEPISTLMRISLLSGFTLALPYIAFELWLFIAPGVGRRTRIIGLLAIPTIALFFVGGMAFTYFILLPNAVPFLLSIMGITTQVRPSSYISFATALLFWVGIAFEFPLVVFLLATLGLVRAKTLAAQWRLAVVVIAVAAAAITPTVDPVNMSLVMAPMIVLYFFSIGLAALAERGRRRRSEELLSQQALK